MAQMSYIAFGLICYLRNEKETVKKFETRKKIAFGAETFSRLLRNGHLGQINFGKEFWDCYWGQEKMAGASPVTFPEVFAKASSPQFPSRFLSDELIRKLLPTLVRAKRTS